MPTRARRHQLTGSLIYHVFNRCVSHTGIFHDEEDFRHFMSLLSQYKDRFFARIYHWAIMMTHFHILLEIDDPAEISRLIAGISLAYTKYHHRRRDTRGYLWQGRFKMQPVQKELYLMACGRYIERNPVRAGLVAEAAEYPFSSARFYCLKAWDGITSTDPAYLRYGRETAQRQAAYKQFLRDLNAGEEDIFKNLDAPAGDERFVSLLRRSNGRCIPKREGRPPTVIYL